MDELIPITTSQGDSDGFDLLWKNPDDSPTEFSATTISLNLRPYTFIAVALIIDGEVRWEIYSRNKGFTQILRDSSGRYGPPSNSNYQWRIKYKYMTIRVADSYVEFSPLYIDTHDYVSATKIDDQGTTTENPTNFAIPLYIYGIR